MNSDQVKGVLQEAGCTLIDRARAAKADAEIKSERAKASDREDRVEIHGVSEVGQGGVDQPDRNRAGKANRKGPRKAEQQAFDQPDRKRA